MRLGCHFPSFEQCLDINVTLVSLEMQRPLCFTLCANGDEIEARAGIPGCSAHTHTLQGLKSVTQFSLWEEETEPPVGWLDSLIVRFCVPCSCACEGLSRQDVEG